MGVLGCRGPRPERLGGRRTIGAMRRPRVHPAVVAAFLLLPVSALAACGDDAPESSPAPAAPSCAFTPAGDAAKKVDLPPSQATATGPVEVTILTSAM